MRSKRNLRRKKVHSACRIKLKRLHLRKIRHRRAVYRIIDMRNITGL